MADIDSNIAELFKIASSAMSTARSTASRITSMNQNVPSISLGYTAPSFKGTKPLALSDMLVLDDSVERLKFLDVETEKWLEKYFPELDGCLKSEPERWLCGIITGEKPFGMSEDYFRAVWLQARDREYLSRNSSVMQIRSIFSSRGFTLPQGAMVQAEINAETTAADAIAAVNIAQAMKDSEIKLDLLKFAEEQALTLKRGILSSLVDFMRTWVELPNKSLEESKLKADAYRSLNSALSDYHRVELGFEELRLKAAEIRNKTELGTWEVRTKASNVDSRNQAVGQATKAFTDIAASSANAAGTLQANITTGV